MSVEAQRRGNRFLRFGAVLGVVAMLVTALTFMDIGVAGAQAGSGVHRDDLAAADSIEFDASVRLFGIEQHPETGHLHVTDTTQDKIHVYDVNNNLIRSYGAESIDGKKLDYPADLTFMDGSVYVTYFTSDHVVRYDDQTGELLNYLDGPSGVVGIDSSDGYVWIADRTARRVYRVNPSLTEAVPFFFGIVGTRDGTCSRLDPNDVVVRGDVMYVVQIDSVGCAAPGIYRVHLPELPQGNVTEAIMLPVTERPWFPDASGYAIALGAPGQIWVTAGGGTYVLRDRTGGVISSIDPSVPGGPTGITVDASGRTAWITYRVPTGGLVVPVTAERCDYEVPTRVGTSAADNFELGAHDIIWTGDSSDTIRAQSGNNTPEIVCGGNGDDFIETGLGADYIYGDNGNDTIWSEFVNGNGDNGTGDIDFIYGGNGNDTIYAGLGIDRIWGGNDNDTIEGGGGSDRIRAGAGNDTVRAGSGADRVWGGPGDDLLLGMGGQDFMYGDEGNDTMQGNFQSDHLWGGPGNDTLRGAGGKDKLFGEAGNDYLYGGNNTDYLNGGPGNDYGDGQKGKDNPLTPNTSGCEQLETKTSC